MTEEARPWPVLSSTLMPTMFACGATPRNCTVAEPPSSSGSEAVPSPAMRPATKVPWPASSYGVLLPLTKSFQPTIRLLPRSEVVAMPLSRTATPTPAPAGPPAAGAATLSSPMARLVTSSELA